MNFKIYAPCSYEFTEDWNLWKSVHKKSYSSEEDEWKRHTIWLANQEYINEHNAEQDVFGFTLAMNQFGDMVRPFDIIASVYCVLWEIT